jgi:HmuY protein
MLNYIKLILLLSLFLLNSCIPEESPVKPHVPGDNELGSTGEFSIYDHQVYYSLSENKVLKSNQYDIWDFNFDCSGKEYYILLNAAKVMKVINLGEVEFESIDKDHIPNADSLIWQIDMPSGSMDSTALGIWWEEDGSNITSKNHVYIVDRGPILSRKTRYAKLQVIGFDGTNYSIKYQIIKDGSDVVVKSIPIDNSLQHISLSIDGEGEVMKLQPPKGQWDLLFSNTAELLWNTEYFQLYGVKSCLINTQYVKAQKCDTTAMETTLGKRVTFEEFTYAQAREFELNNNLNVIGHDWKSPGSTTPDAVYSVDPAVLFVIQDTKGDLYKLHFIRYDSDQGLGKKGYPGFEFKRF